MMTLSTQDLDFDRDHIWHPYTSALHPLTNIPIVAADGCELILADGKRLIDGMSSWWAAIHGYNVPQLNSAAQQQIQQLPHVMFGGITHEPAIRLSQQLLELAPEPMEHVFLADSGSVAVEVALKMALQYQAGQGRPQRRRFITACNGYHGDTFGAMSICDPVNGMHKLFSGFMANSLFLPAPPGTMDLPMSTAQEAELEQAFAQHSEELAAFIIEPVAQGAGGMRFYDPGYLSKVRALCNEHDILLIFDEIATGFGRTGKLWGTDHCSVTADIMCVGKALTGGYMTLSATLCTHDVAKGVCASDAGVFMHGPTFMANPLACAVASASLKLLIESPWQQRVQAIETQLQQELKRCWLLPGVKDVRVLGAIGVVELEQPMELAQVQPKLVEMGVWIRPFGRLLYIMPPYVIEPDALSRLTQAMEQLVRILAEQ